MKRLLLGLMLAASCQAQIVVKNHDTGSLLASPLLLPDTPVNDFLTQQIDIVNSGGANVTIASAAATGQFYSLCCQSSFVISAGGIQTLTLTFSPTQTGYFSGAIEIDDTTVYVFTRSIAAVSAFVTTDNGTTQIHSGSPNVVTASGALAASLPAALQNNSNSPVTITTLTAMGSFTVVAAPALPFTMQPGDQITFALAGSGPSGLLSGTLEINQWPYAIEAHPPFPNFTIQISPTPLTSNQVANVSIQFDQPPAESLTGNLRLQFASSTSTALADPAILFPSTGSAAATFSSVGGQIGADFAGSSTASFQTGTTAGILTIDAVIGFTEAKITVPLTPGPITIESIAGSRESGALDVAITGFDNTRTAGRMTFSFLDSQGAYIGNPVPADFTEDFYNFFFGPDAESGGIFKMTVRFPVTGDSGAIAGVTATLENSAGATQSAQAKF